MHDSESGFFFHSVSSAFASTGQAKEQDGGATPPFPHSCRSHGTDSKVHGIGPCLLLCPLVSSPEGKWVCPMENSWTLLFDSKDLDSLFHFFCVLISGSADCLWLASWGASLVNQEFRWHPCHHHGRSHAPRWQTCGASGDGTYSSAAKAGPLKLSQGSGRPQGAALSPPKASCSLWRANKSPT